MQKGSFYFRKQIDLRGYSCSVEIIIRVIKKSGTPEFNLTVSKENEEMVKPWKLALEYGGRLFLEKFNQGMSLNVEITNFHWMTVDTTLPVVTYTMFKTVILFLL